MNLAEWHQSLAEWHLADPIWLLGLLLIPLVWIAYFLFFRKFHSSKHLEQFIDPHLLPFLIVKTEKKKSVYWKTLLAWSFVWSCLILALAGPRWNYREIEAASKDQALVLLLDLSESMNADDIKPSRLIRAKQKIEDLLNASQSVKIGLIAFAADSHMISPITDDKETIRHLLPSLSTDLVYIQGSKLAPALKMASIMLESEPGENKSIVILSDGGFEDRSAIAEVKQLADQGFLIHAIGLGTSQGTVLKDHQGAIVKKNGIAVTSKLSRAPMEEVARMGGGYYIEQNYSPHKDEMILDSLEKKAGVLENGKKIRFWEEGFLWLLLPALPFVLWWFRKQGHLFTIALFLSANPFLEAGIRQDYFMNSEELGNEFLEEGDYASAANIFQDPYRKGVACYKAGNFAEAEEMFKQSFRQEAACDAAYNLGNAQAKQQKFKEAMTAYENVLKDWPNHQKAKENLELIKKILEQQKQEEQKSSEQQEQEQQENKESSDKNSQNQKSNDSQEESNDSQEENKENKSEQNEDSNSAEDRKNDPSDPSKDQNSQESASEAEKQNQNSDSKQAEHDLKDENPKEPASMEQTPSAEEEPQGAEENKNGKQEKTQQDLDADVWLNRLSNDPKKFLKNKFYLESKQNETKEGIDPW